MEHWTKNFSCVTGVTRGDNIGAFAMVNNGLSSQQIEHTVPVIYANGEWGTPDVDELKFTTVSMAMTFNPIRQAVYLGLHGNIFFVGSGDEHEEVIESITCSPSQIGMMRALKEIDGELYATGMRRQVYKRLEPNHWEHVGKQITTTDPVSLVTSFEAIDGFSRDDLYAVGRLGEIWHYDGKQWERLPSPTNVILTGVHCASDGFVYICGRTGVVLKGRGSRWQAVDNSVTKADFWSVTSFNKRIFLSTMFEVLELTDKGLEIVNFGKDRPGSFFHLSVGPDSMWSVGAKDVMTFDGKQWTRID
jgi:hypothetical protein